MQRRLRAIGHHLRPVVIIGEAGPGEGTRDELARALADHELVKIKVQINERDARREVIAVLARDLEAEVVQQIGKVALVYRANPEAKAKLSNVPRG